MLLNKRTTTHSLATQRYTRIIGSIGLSPFTKLTTWISVEKEIEDLQWNARYNLKVWRWWETFKPDMEDYQNECSIYDVICREENRKKRTILSSGT